MIDHTFDPASAILTIRPSGPLKKEDFENLAREIDPSIERTGDLAGLLIDAKAFPGWDSFGALAAHIRFVRDHHRHVRRIAVVTDSALGNLLEKLASHFVAATIRHFKAGELEQARAWIVEGATPRT